MSPGEWEVVVETLGTTMTGSPEPKPAPAPRQGKVVSRTCLTREQVERPSALTGGGMLEPFRRSCRYDSFVMAGGRLDARMRCAVPGGPVITAVTHGTFAATALSAESESSVRDPASGADMTTRVRMTGRRVGPCRSGEG